MEPDLDREMRQIDGEEDFVDELPRSMLE